MFFSSARTFAAGLLIVLSAPSAVAAALPPMPGMTSGLGMSGNGMIHAEVAVQGGVVSVVLRDGPSGGAQPTDRLVTMVGGGYDTPYDVLNGRMFNAQYGWLPDQTVPTPPGPIQIGLTEQIWIEPISVTGPGSVSVYEGGNGEQLMNTGHTMNPIFGTDGSDTKWLWDDDFLMQHNWYVFDTPGDYDITYRVYVGDNSGAAIQSYTPADITLRFTAIPEPGVLSMLGLTSLALLSMRRRDALRRGEG